MKNIRLIVDNDRKAKQPYFIKKELQTILNLYAKMVSNGTWKDYSLYTGNKEISFNIYKRASEKPILRILKNLKPTSTLLIIKIIIFQFIYLIMELFY